MVKSSAPRVYSAEQVGVAAGLGGPLAAAVLLKLNYRAFGRQPIAALPLAWGLALTFVLVTLALRRTGGGGIVGGVWIGLNYWRYASHLQGATIAEKINAGNRRHGWLRTILVSLIVLMGTVVLFVLLGSVLEAYGVSSASN